MGVMKKSIFVVAGVLVLLFGVVSVYIYFAGGSGEATREVQARRVEPREPEPAGETTGEGETAPPPPVIYAAVPGRSEARFLIDEVLRGSPTTVRGVTDQIDGSLALRRDPPYLDIGEFEINLRTIATDDEMRDRTIRAMILETNRDEFEFSTFVPLEIRDTPDVIRVGEPFQVEVTGDLTVRDVTRRITFDMELQVQSDDEVTGFATTSFTWDEFDITIPYVGGNSIVSAVDDVVRIEMEFVATAIGD